MSRAPPVALLGLDACEWTLVERWIAEGRLPVLAELQRRGVHGRLASPAGSYAGGVWPCVYGGVDVATHGIYHNKQWRPAAMRVEVPDEAWLGRRAFWETAGDQGRRVCIVDVPMVLGRPRPLNGVHLSGWGTHDLIASGSWPPSLWQELARRHGAPSMPRERYGLQDARSLLRLRDEMLCTTEQQLAVALDLAGREHWDLTCIVFGAAHRAGHYLWDLGQLSRDDVDAEVRARLESALCDVYRGIDAAVGRVLARLDPDTRVCAFSAHGMGANPGWSDVFPAMLGPLQAAVTGDVPRRGLLYALRQRLPFEWVRPLLTRLPTAVTAGLVHLWSSRMFDWSKTRVFPVPMDHAGYVRVNLRGRERLGIVEPGAEYEQLCADLAAVIEGLRDADSGAPIVRRVHRPWLDASPSAARRDLLPDLLVEWTDVRCGDVRRVVSESLPGHVFELPARLPSGRSGNHTDGAWFIAAGPGIAAGARIDGHDVRDLAPTVAAWLGIEPDTAWQGRPIPPTGTG